MTRSIAMAVAVVSLAVWVIGPAGGASAAEPAPITGAGSTWAHAAVERWRQDTAIARGLRVDYVPVGSTHGRAGFIAGTVDFAVSELPFQTGPDAGPTPEDPRRPFAYVPLVAGGISLAYNLRVDGDRFIDLRLSGETVAGIFSGRITRWDDPLIRADNPGVAMPARDIVPVVRSDASAATARFTGWMAEQFPASWTGGTSQVFPVPAPSFRSAAGSVGVAGYTSQAYAEGAITYVETSEARSVGLPSAKLLNPAGYYVGPTQDSVAIALLSAATGGDGAPSLAGVGASTDPRAYPLSQVASMIVPTATDPAFTDERGATLAAFGAYAVCDGQQSAGELGDAPLPITLVQAAAEQIARIPGAAAVDLATCANPTFTAGDTAESNRLLRDAPMPPPEARKPAPAPGADDGTGGEGDGEDDGEPDPGPAAPVASGRFELIGPSNAEVFLGAAAAGRMTQPVRLGGVSVVDDRSARTGWELRIDVQDLLGEGGALIPRSAVGYTPLGADLPVGIAASAGVSAGSGSYPSTFATGAPGSTTGPGGAGFDADLTFRPPVTAARGSYRSTLTLTLIPE